MNGITLPDSNAAAEKPRAGHATLSDQVYEAVKQMVFDFELMPGMRFSEAELTERLKVSRTPLRQALQRLAGQGFLQVLPKMGWYVAPIDFDVMDELYDLRTLIECHAVQLLVDNPGAPALQTLQDVWLVPPERRLSDGAQVGRLDEVFHSSLVLASGNREMTRVHQDVTDRIRLIRRLDFTKPARVCATYDEHAAILKAILMHRRDDAQRLLKAHIEHSKIEVRKITLEALYTARGGHP